jgi:AhpD family alkylhydroperoxidase
MHLVKMRASQINGCAYCLDMHSKDARAEGETEQRLFALAMPGARRRFPILLKN